MRHPSEATAYIRKLFAPETSATRQARELLETHAPEIAGISIGAEEGKLLQLLIRMNGVKRIVEIGSLTGYSGLWMAEALPEDGEIHLIEKDPHHAALIRQQLLVTRGQEAEPAMSPRSGAPCEKQNVSQRGQLKITLHEGSALDILPTLSGSFDMVFIDADKPGYPRYLDWAEGNIRKGGVIVGDNTFLFGHIWKETPPPDQQKAWQAMREFNQRLADPQKYLSTLIPTEEGMTVAIKRF